PSLTLGALYAAYIARLTRGGMLEILSQDFIRTARAKGASNLRVILKHALRGGLLPVVNYLGPTAAALVTGSFAVETIFQIPGLGRYFVKAVISAVILILIVLASFIGPFFLKLSYETQNLQLGAVPPGVRHWLGTDTLGRDLFVRILYGGRVSMSVGFCATAIALTIGVFYG